MAKCPYCEEQIEYLDAVVKERNLYTFGEMGHRRSEETIEFTTDYYKCPKCNSELDLLTDDDAIEFLRGEPLEVPKNTITIKMAREYVDGGGLKCPFCHAEDGVDGGCITGSPVQIDGPYAYQVMTCAMCGNSYRDCYRLEAVIPNE